MTDYVVIAYHEGEVRELTLKVKDPSAAGSWIRAWLWATDVEEDRPTNEDGNPMTPDEQYEYEWVQGAEMAQLPNDGARIIKGACWGSEVLLMVPEQED